MVRKRDARSLAATTDARSEMEEKGPVTRRTRIRASMVQTLVLRQMAVRPRLQPFRVAEDGGAMSCHGLLTDRAIQRHSTYVLGHKPRPARLVSAAGQPCPVRSQSIYPEQAVVSTSGHLPVCRLRVAAGWVVRQLRNVGGPPLSGDAAGGADLVDGQVDIQVP
jgi:hypothetical protein